MIPLIVVVVALVVQLSALVWFVMESRKGSRP